MKTEINHQWIYEESPEEIWAYLTQSELIALWLMPNNFKAIKGHEFEFRINPIPSLNLNGIFYCKIIEIIPLKKLVYTWKGGPDNDTTIFDTLVEWTLEKNGSGTVLNLKHTGFKDENYNILTSMTDGWLKNIEKMHNYIIDNNNANT